MTAIETRDFGDTKAASVRPANVSDTYLYKLLLSTEGQIIFSLFDWCCQDEQKGHKKVIQCQKV